jgi:hypothetical protein
VAKLKYTDPSIGEKNTIADPLIIAAFSEIKKWAAGEINSESLEAGGVEESKLSAALQSKLGSFVGLPLESQKSVIATEQERAATSFGTLTTPDEVSVTIPTNGLIAVTYEAQWKQSVEGAARAAIFIGTNQLKVPTVVAGREQPGEQEAAIVGSTGLSKLVSCPIGLIGSRAEGYIGDVTTGQVLGAVLQEGAHYATGTKYLTGTGTEPAALGGPCLITRLAAGTYVISVRFKATSGSVKVSQRALRAWAIG